MSAIEQSVRARVAGILGVPSGQLDCSKPLSRLGLDSLGMLQLSASIERDLGEWPDAGGSDLTIELLAGLLGDGVRVQTRPSPDSRERMLADSILPPEIRPQGSPESTPRSILLTGATGFLGAHLLATLLQTTEARLVCLVRPGPGSPGRVRQTLDGYGIYRDDFDGRIRVVDADLSQPRLGISSVDFNALAGSVDAVFHSAASVNWVQSYAMLRNSNVLAVRELLRLACHGRPKPFHFISSLGVCYSSSGPREIDESGDAFCDLEGIHLAYAQSKLVAEALVRIAAQRGLPVRIFRPSFIAGNSATGASNTSDFVSSLIKGCVQMAAAPDLDWQLDSVPVDFVAAAISRLALGQDSAPLRVFHLANPRERHWRELILWMNLYGYRVPLLPYREWLDRLDKEASQPGHPLRNLAPFFRSRPGGNSGPYLPQLYEESRKRRVECVTTNTAVAGHGLQCPGLTTSLIDRFFTSFVERQFLPPVAGVHKRRSQSFRIDSSFFRDLLAPSMVASAIPVDLAAADSVIGELTSWKYGQSIGLHGYRLHLVDLASSAPKKVDVVVKVKARDRDVREVGQEVATLCSPALGEAYHRFSSRLGVSHSDVREWSLYRESDERLRRYTPRFYGGWTDGGQTILVLEKLSGMTLMNSTDRPEAWKPEHIEAAIDGLGEIHSIWYGRTAELPDRWNIGPRATLSSMLEASPLWSSLAEHASPIFSKWTGPGFCALQRELMDSLDRWWSEVEGMPHTLIHNDCNPRNLAFRQTAGPLRLCLYDWELATPGLPQHDLAELLCFVLGAQCHLRNVACYIERHRRVLERHSGHAIDANVWRQGFRLSLNHLMINRLPAYAMIHRFQKQRFLERVVRTWMSLKECV